MILHLFIIFQFSILVEARETQKKTGLIDDHTSHKIGSTSLSLKDAIKRTLENNVTIAIEDYNSKVKSENVIKNQSEFDATFEIDLSIDEKTQQQASAFSSPNKSRNKNHNWDISLSQKLPTGADYELSFKNKKNTSNSKTLGLNPNYSTGLKFNITQPLLKDFGIDLNKHNIYIAKNEVT